MKRLPYFLLALALFALINLPRDWADHWRSQTVKILNPLWRQVSSPSNFSIGESAELFSLRAQVEALQEWLVEEKRFQAQADGLADLVGKDANALRNDGLRRAVRQKQLLAMRYAATPAQVVFRDPSSWSSSLWISLGEVDNEAIGRVVVARNSPVLVGNSLVGVVEYVGRSQSRIRLISDLGLVPAVRAVRGGAQNRELSYHVQNLLEHIRVRSELFPSPEEKENCIGSISSLQEKLVPSWKEEILAKGELHGCSAPLWRSRGIYLRGTGFNYDYADEDGPARDLRTGRPLGTSAALPFPLLMVGDILVTSGLDGIFPPSIPVAIVTKVFPLKEGSYSYDLEAKPTAGDLQDLSTLFVLPPLGENF